MWANTLALNIILLITLPFIQPNEKIETIRREVEQINKDTNYTTKRIFRIIK